MRGKEERARSGRIPQAFGRGCSSYTYNPESGRREIEPYQAAIVRRIFARYAATRSFSAVASELNDAGIPAFAGGAWYPITVRRVLLNEAYIGRTVYRRTKRVRVRAPGARRRTRVIERPEEEWIDIPGATPPIISDDLWRRVQAILDDPERTKRRTVSKRQYMLSGRLRCGLCRSAMVGQTQTSMGQYRYYRWRRAYAGPRHDRCPTRYVRAGALEDAVVREVTAVLSSPEVVLAELEHTSAGDRADRDLAGARALLNSLDKQRKRLLRLYQLGEVDDAYLQKELASIQARRSPAEATVARLNESGLAPQVPKDADDFAATCDILRERVLAEVDAGRLKGVAQAMQLSVEVQKTDNGASGLLKGVIPYDLGSFGGKISHHCTNIGMTTCT